MSGFFQSRDPIVVEAVRGDVVESTGEVDAVVVDADGEILGFAGDYEKVACFRSSLKPIQAAVSIACGWKPSSIEQIAIACSSHNAEPEHLHAVRSILEDAGLEEDALRCPPALPLLDTEAAKAGSPRKILRDCSGKHAGFLAACVANGWPIDSYLSQDHPLQQAIIEHVRALCGRIDSVEVDGCGAPTPATSLARIAKAFGAGLAMHPEVSQAMRAHPFLVAGTKRICTDLMSNHATLVLKAGAEGILCAHDPATGIALALKVRDGWSRFVAPATIDVLMRLGIMEPPFTDAVELHAHPPVLGGGVKAGTLRVVR
ncbi:MAG: asparaginase [Actinomycetota bacterium]